MVEGSIEHTFIEEREILEGGAGGEIAGAGADTFVAGSAIFGSEDYAATITAMKDEIKKAG